MCLRDGLRRVTALKPPSFPLVPLIVGWGVHTFPEIAFSSFEV